MVFHKGGHKQTDEMPGVKREFSGGFGFFSFFKRPEMFKAGLLLLEVV